MESRAIFVLGEVERTFACAAEAESMDGEGVRSWTFFSTFEGGEGFALDVDALGEGGRGTVSGGGCALREKKPNTIVPVVYSEWLFCTSCLGTWW